MRSLVRVALAASLALALVACSDDDGAVAPTAESSTSETTSTTAPTTTAPPPSCGDDPMPSQASDVVTAEGDVDGDGEADELSTYRVGEGDWRVHVALAAGGGADAPLVAFGGFIGVMGGADVDGDGSEEIWVRTGAGASATIVGLLRFQDCELVRVTFEGGEPAELPVGGSVGTLTGVECQTFVDPDADITAYTASRIGDDEYEVTATEYALEGTVLVERGSTAGSASSSEDDFFRYTSLSCGPVSL